MSLAEEIFSSVCKGMGDEADAVVGSEVIQVLFEEPGEVLDGFGGVIATNPTALVSGADVAACSIIGGTDGTPISINGIDYTVLAVVPNGTGLMRLTLELA